MQHFFIWMVVASEMDGKLGPPQEISVYRREYIQVSGSMCRHVCCCSSFTFMNACVLYCLNTREYIVFMHPYSNAFPIQNCWREQYITTDFHLVVRKLQHVQHQNPCWTSQNQEVGNFLFLAVIKEICVKVVNCLLCIGFDQNSFCYWMFGLWERMWSR